MNKEEFQKAILHHSKLVKNRHELCLTEEASKTSLILPFFRDVLGYDVDNPSTFIPEYVSTPGSKKDQRVDYAIIKDGKPEVLIEAKWNGCSLDGYETQLFNYFSATSAKLGILTNGVIYRFFCDLDSDNRMDITPFREIDMTNLSEKDIDDLYSYQQELFSINDIVDAAAEMKYSGDIISLLNNIFNDPDNEFTSFIMKRVYNGKKTAKSIKNFQTILKHSIDQFLSSKISTSAEKKKERDSVQEPQKQDNGIITTQDEIEAYYIIRTLIHEATAPSRIQYKDCRSYFAVLLDGKTTQWVCRLYPNKNAKWQIHFPTDDPKKPVTIDLASNDEIYDYKERLITAVKKYL